MLRPFSIGSAKLEKFQNVKRASALDFQFLSAINKKNFTVKHKGKTYYVDYLNSDGQILGLSNRDYWEVYNEDDEELPNHKIKGDKVILNKKELRLKIKLIKFCIKHFEDYRPDPDDC